MSIEYKIQQRMGKNGANNTQSSNPNSNCTIDCSQTIEKRGNILLKPFESHSSNAVTLDFNYWVENDHLLDDDILELILKSMIEKSDFTFSNNKVSFLRNSESRDIDRKNIILVTIHNCDPQMIANNISLLPFLSTCSAVPIHHINSNGQNLESNQGLRTFKKEWQYYDVQDMNAQVLWPINNCIDKESLTEVSPLMLFKQYDLIFRAEHFDWFDELFFYHTVDQKTVNGETKNSDCNSYSDIVSKVLELVSSKQINTKSTDVLYVHYEELSEIKSGDVIGYFRRVKSGDSGMYVLRSNDNIDHPSTNLYLLWYKWDLEVLSILGKDLEDNLDIISLKENTSSLAFKTLHSAAVTRINSLISTENKEIIQQETIQLHITLCKAFVGKSIQHVKKMSNYDNSSELDELIDIIEPINTNIFPHTFISKDMISKFQKLLNPSSILWEKIENLVLNNDIMDMLGYSFQTYSNETVLLDTSASNWNVVDSNGSVASQQNVISKASKEVEEGEELENDDDNNMDVETRISTPGFDESLESSLGKRKNGSEEAVKNGWIPLKLDDNIIRPLRICAIDCEMCATESGLELTRLTVVCPLQGVVFDSLVKPTLPIIEYHTEFSGMTEEILQNVTTTLFDVQFILRQLISSNTIIVGHSLECDLKVLRVKHARVIDTTALFPHHKGLPYKYSLKKLANDFLKTIIQDDKEGGHDSIQDAVIALRLAILKAEKGDDFGNPPIWSDYILPRSPLAVRLSHNIQQNDIIIRYSKITHTNSWISSAFGRSFEGDLKLAAKLSIKNDFNSNLKNGIILKEMNNIIYEEFQSNELIIENTIKFMKENRNSRSFSWLDLSYEDDYIPSDVINNKDKLPLEVSNYDVSTSQKGNNMTALMKYYADKKIKDNNEKITVIKDEETQPILPKSLVELDTQLEQLLQNSPSNTMIVIMTQGSLKAVKLLAAKKQRNKWEYAAMKKKTGLSDCVRTSWDTNDERQLIAAAANAISGVAFFTKRS
eukprot:gene6799-9314_t